MITEYHWQRAYDRLRAELQRTVFDNWLSRMALARIAGSTVHATLPTPFLCGWVRQHYAPRLTELLREHDPEAALVLEARRIDRQPPLRPDVHPQPAVAPMPLPAVHGAPAPSAVTERRVGLPLDARLTFGSFVIAEPNRFAHDAGRNVASLPPGTASAYSPLVVCGPSGVGKTHLLNAIAAEAEERGRQVVFISAQMLPATAKGGRVPAVPVDCLQDTDLLLIDDIQFLARLSQPMLEAALNRLDAEGASIVIASDRKPADLDCGVRLRSRLDAGVCAEIGDFDTPLRRRVFAAKAAALARLHPGFSVSAEVAEFVCQFCRGNGRQIDGALKRLMAHGMAADGPMTVERAREAVQDLMVASDPRKVRVDSIVSAVSRHYRISREDLLSQRRTANVVMPRQIAMYLSKELTLRSLSEIGRRFGGRDHTTILHAVRKIDGLRRENPELDRAIVELSRTLCDGPLP